MPRHLRSPITWFGGKGNLVAKLLPLIPPHHTYVEPFGGGASLLFAKEPSPVEVYNDLDSGLVNLFRVLRDPDKFERFRLLASLTPYAREEYNHLRKTWSAIDDDVERAWAFFVIARQSFSGEFGASWKSGITASTRGMARNVSAYLSSIACLPEVHSRLMRVQVEHMDFRHVIKRYDTPETFFYLDPPYVPSTRRSGGYRYEMDESDHRDLADMLLGIQGKALLSGYRHAVHEVLEQSGWTRIDFFVTCHAAGKTRQAGILGQGSAKEKQPRVESVWLNYNPKEVACCGRPDSCNMAGRA